MITTTPTIYVVDDDVSVRESLEGLAEESGWRAETFASAHEFLQRPRSRNHSCLILDVGLPDLNGLEVQQRVSDHPEMPIIFITGAGDIPTTVKAMKAGAVEFLTKPYSDEALISAIDSALARSRALLEENAGLQMLRDRHQMLSRREKEVMALVVRGQLNKQVAGTLGISEITVKAHRGRMMRRMKVRTVAELISVASRIGLTKDKAE